MTCCRLCFEDGQVDNNGVCEECNRIQDTVEENELEERAIERRYND